jgi:superfamily II DNA/RNA helicase
MELEMKQRFEQLGLDEQLLDALKRMGYHQPTQVQLEVIPRMLKGESLLVKAQTGSGKTAAFAVPLCQMVEVEQRHPQALILAPTRELALQIKEETARIGTFQKIRVAAVFGRHPIHLQQQELRQRVHIVVGTPGRVLDLIQRGMLHIDDIRQVILDEADEMLGMGFYEQVEAVLETLPKEKKIHMFSATMPKTLTAMYERFAPEHVIVEIQSDSRVEDRIRHQVVYTGEGVKERIIHQILQQDQAGSCILFCNTRDDVEALAAFLEKRRYRVGMLHGGLSQRERFRVMNLFKRGEVHLLVTTNVAARGIDVDEVTHVINVQVPFEQESVVHRSGRTGRMEKTGIAITLVSPREEQRWDTLANVLGVEADIRTMVEDPDLPEQVRGMAMARPLMKVDKNKELLRGVGRIRINGGKDKKFRPVDIMGAIGSIEHIEGEDVGIIDIQHSCTYVEIFHGKAPMVAKALGTRTIKGKVRSVKVLR